jgi:hypothetical protein
MSVMATHTEDQLRTAAEVVGEAIQKARAVVAARGGAPHEVRPAVA